MSLPKKAWVNGRLINTSRPAISVFDRGFLYGDGVFETLRVYQGRIFRYNQHFERLEHSASAIRMGIPSTKAGLCRSIEKTLKANRFKEASVRITLSRGPAPRGYDTSLARRPTLTVLAFPITPPLEKLRENGVRLAIVRTRRVPRAALDPAIKSTNNLNNILAAVEARELGSFEGLMLNVEGHVAEGTVSNVFFFSAGVLKTPSLDCGILAGVTRSLVMELAQKHGIRVVEGSFRPRDLIDAQEAFITSTTVEILPVTRVVDTSGQVHKIGKGQPGTWAHQLRQDYTKTVFHELALSS